MLRLKRGAPWAIALAAVAVALLMNPAIRVNGRAVPPVVSLEMNVPGELELYSVTGAPLAISPNGAYVAFTANNKRMRRMAFVRQTDQQPTRELSGTELSTSLFFWPDETALGVNASDGTLRKVSLKDGKVVTLATNVDYNSGATVGSDGSIVYVRERTLWTLPSGGGEPVRLTTLNPQAQESAEQWPVFLPDGRTVLFTSFSSDTPGAHIEAVTLANGQRVTLVADAAFPMYAPGGTLIFLRGGALFAARLDPGALKLAGEPVRMVDQVAVTSSGAPIAAVSANGTLVYAAADATAATLVSVTRQGVETPLQGEPRSYSAPRLSPDGQRVVVASDGSRLWMRDSIRGLFTPLTPPETNTGWPVWTPDGRVLYRSISGVHWVGTDGRGGGGIIVGTSQQDVPCSVSPDGTTLAFLRISPDTQTDIYTLGLNGRSAPQPLVRTPAFEGGPRFSPDGRWIAYASNESGRFQVYIRPFPGPDRRFQVSTEGGTFPVWSRKGDELFYRDGHRLMAVRISGLTAVTPTISNPEFLFERRYQAAGTTIAGYDVSLDGQSFIFVKPEPIANQLNVRLNWFGDLERHLEKR
jgi:serine/threonine-protein kinase